MTVTDLSNTDYAKQFITNSLSDLNNIDHNELINQISFLEMRKELPPELGTVKDMIFSQYGSQISGASALLSNASAIKAQGMKFLSGNIDLLTPDMCNFMSGLLDFNNIEDMLRSLLSFKCIQANIPDLTSSMSGVITAQNAFSKLASLQGTGQDVFSTVSRLQNGDFISTSPSAACGLVMKIINELGDSLKNMLGEMMDLFSGGLIDIAGVMNSFTDKLKQIVSSFIGGCVGKSDSYLGIDSDFSKAYKEMASSADTAPLPGTATTSYAPSADDIFGEVTEQTFEAKPTTSLEDLAAELKRKGL